MSLIIAFAALNWWVATRHIDASPIVDPSSVQLGEPNPSSSYDLLLDDSRLSLEALTETLKRPLFSADRRPPRLKVTVTQPPAPARRTHRPPPPFPKSLRLIGIVQIGSAPARALLRASHVQEGITLAVGDTFQAWRLRHIGKEKIVLEAGKHRRVLRLESDQNDAGQLSD